VGVIGAAGAQGPALWGRRVWGRLLAERLREWLLEDVPYVDETAELLGLGGTCGVLRVVAKNRAVVACVEEVAEALWLLGVEAEALVRSGSVVEEGRPVLLIRGRGDVLSSVERVVLNILIYSSGVATRTREMVEEARRANPRVRVAATRKTVPGFRLCSKLAFAQGGGDPYRWSLSDAVMVKDTHVELLGGLRAALERLRRRSPYRVVIVEASSPRDAVAAAEAGADAVLLDNMSPEEVRDALRLLEERGLRGRVVVEASGGITPDNVEAYAATGVDVVSTSYPFLAPARVDFSAEARPEPCSGRG
jgi:nicotinate-nucleotide pyrophosphorylase (carboxylating)